MSARPSLLEAVEELREALKCEHDWQRDEGSFWSNHFTCPKCGMGAFTRTGEKPHA